MSNVSAILRRELGAYFDAPLAYFVVPVYVLLVGAFALWFDALFAAGVASLRGLFFWASLFLVLLVLSPLHDARYAVLVTRNVGGTVCWACLCVATATRNAERPTSPVVVSEPAAEVVNPSAVVDHPAAAEYRVCLCVACGADRMSWAFDCNSVLVEL